MRTPFNPETGRESPDTVSCVPDCSQKQNLAFRSEKRKLASLLSQTLKIYLDEGNQKDNKKHTQGSAILTEVELAQPEISSSELQTRFEQLAQQPEHFWTKGTSTRFWKAYLKAKNKVSVTRTTC